MQKLAIFGGTFNPVHRGHLLAAETALCQFNLDQILWVPTYCPSYKNPADLPDFTHRLAMVRVATSQLQSKTIALVASDFSFAIDTFTVLQARYPQSEWYWILGLDSFQSLPRWYRRHELIPSCTWLVAPRTSTPLHRVSEPASSDRLSTSLSTSIGEQVSRTLAAEAISIEWQPLEMPLIDVSSSLVRQYCREGKPIDALLPNSVQNYIQAHHLYQS
ncbi:MAG TPA: nicotinate (nicotinamide) nucleotide adenylyltransferase [Trichocoleus sp.]|jgi:nicotinate-nucleotide adenylyltransferase